MTVTHPKTTLSAIVSDYGWLPASPMDQHLTSILATKEYTTAVGPKTAFLYVCSAGAGCYRLTADYNSEGRNVLSTISGHFLESGSDDELAAVLDRVAKAIDAAVDASYARRLLLRWPAKA